MRVWVITLGLLMLTGVAAAQHGSAPDGYYPINYAGDTWSGTVTAVDLNTREITLSYQDKGKEENFVGTLQKGYRRKDKSGKFFEVPMTSIPVGSYMIAYYMAKTRKENGEKTKYLEIFDFKLYETGPKNK